MARSTLREQLEQEKADHEETRIELGTLIETVRRNHDDAHTEVFRYCTDPVCREAGLLEYPADVRGHL